jgi:hypothetical protein
MAILLTIMIFAILFGGVFSYRKNARLAGPRSGVRKSSNTGLIILLAFTFMAILLIMFTRGI